MTDYLITNIASLIAQNNLSNTQSSLTTAIQRLSSGLRINSAADDAASYAIAQNMTTQINGSNQAALNASNGVSLAQTAQGDLSTILTNLQSAYSLAVESANATNTTANRQALNDQVQQLLQENQRISQSSNFNGVNLLDGSFKGETFQVGANSGGSNQITIGGIPSMQLNALGGAGTTYSTTVSSNKPLQSIPLNAGDITLNGYQVGASVAGNAAGQSADSAHSIAQAINAISAQSAVTATANATIVSTTTTSGTAISAGVISINGISVGAIAGSATAVGEAANAATAINAISSQTGVTATAGVNSQALTLTAADGRNIAIGGSGPTSGTALSQVGLWMMGVFGFVEEGAITLTSNDAKGITIGGNAPSNAGFTGFTIGTTVPQSTVTGQSLTDANVLSVTGAQNAMVAIQGAINTVTSNAAALGAYQNRFTAVVTGIQTDSQNLSQSLARIQDTNYAQETAILSQQNVLSQAGTAMLAQTNHLPNQILTLLR